MINDKYVYYFLLLRGEPFTLFARAIRGGKSGFHSAHVF